MTAGRVEIEKDFTRIFLAKRFRLIIRIPVNIFRRRTAARNTHGKD